MMACPRWRASPVPREAAEQRFVPARHTGRMSANLETPSLDGRVRASFMASVGDIVFGMEDGAVSIFGLVFGVAAASNDSQAVVLAGATGAVAAAVSMMAGAYLDAASVRDRARSQVAAKQEEARRDPEGVRKRIADRLRGIGFTDDEAAVVVTALTREPGAMLAYEETVELRLGGEAEQDPRAHAAWMFVADVFAAAVPVIPFVFLPIDTARIVSLTITTALLVVLGIGRALVARTNVIVTTLQTLGIAAAAAVAGVAIGRLVGG
jgi:vacuolar iron transporter family protein